MKNYEKQLIGKLISNFEKPDGCITTEVVLHTQNEKQFFTITQVTEIVDGTQKTNAMYFDLAQLDLLIDMLISVAEHGN